MSVTKITPQQALDAIRVLNPEAETLYRQDDEGLQNYWKIRECEYRFRQSSEIDWPEGVTQWPPPLKPIENWRTATVDDVNPKNPVRCRMRADYMDSWRDGLLLSVFNGSCYAAIESSTSPFYVHRWNFCEVLEVPQ